MGAIFNFIAILMGYVIKVLYDITLNYGVAIILFTIVIKILTLPLTIKQQKSLLETQKIQPLVTEIQKKYSKDNEKINMEVAKLYKEKKVNPFSGCLLLLVQFPIIIAMFMVIQQPITYMFRENIEIPSTYTDNYNQVYYIANERPDMLNMNFLGLNLGQVPKNNIKNPILWIIPLLSGITTYLSSKVSMSQQQKTQNNSDQSKQMESMSKNMMTFFPLMTTYISFIVPLGMGVYWLVNNIVTVGIQLGINKKLNRDNSQKKVKFITEGK